MIRNIIRKILQVILNKNFILLVLVILCVIFGLRACKPDSLKNLPKADLVLKPVVQYTDKAGNDHAVIPTNVVSKAIMQYKMDSIARAVKADMINQYTQWTNKTDTSFHDIPVAKSVNDEDSMTYKDNYISLTAKMKDGKGSFHLEGTDTTTYIDKVDKRFLRSNIRTIDISNKSPYNKITHGTNITLVQPKIILTAGPSAGWMWSMNQGKVEGRLAVGVTVTMNVLPLLKTK